MFTVGYGVLVFVRSVWRYEERRSLESIQGDLIGLEMFGPGSVQTVVWEISNTVTDRHDIDHSARLAAQRYLGQHD
jgi:hypothetical protein